MVFRQSDGGAGLRPGQLRPRGAGQGAAAPDRGQEAEQVGGLRGRPGDQLYLGPPEECDGNVEGGTPAEEEGGERGETIGEEAEEGSKRKEDQAL